MIGDSFAEVIGINQKRLFTLTEAQRLLPVVRRITKDAQQKIENLNLQLDSAGDPAKKNEVEARIRTTFQIWYEKIQKLGCETKGMGLVDFDSGEGYFCWSYPEPEISFFHGYFDGFQGRTKIQ